MNLQHIINQLKSEEPNNYNKFTQVLDLLSKESKQIITMVELGCGSAYYSALFNETFKAKAKNILVEPYIEWWKNFGEGYFANKERIFFYNNYIGKIVWAHWGGPEDESVTQMQKEVSQITLNQLLQETSTEDVDILHMDLQGSEYYILEDIIKNNLINKFTYIFIMTHDFDNDNYQSYINLLTKSSLNYEFVFNDKNYKENGDGLIILKIIS